MGNHRHYGIVLAVPTVLFSTIGDLTVMNPFAIPNVPGTRSYLLGGLGLLILFRRRPLATQRARWIASDLMHRSKGAG